MKRKGFTKQVRQQVYDMFNGHCAYCGCELTLKEMQVDHIDCYEIYASIYEAEGKDINAMSNLYPSCRACNFYKSTMTVDHFRRELGKLTTRLKRTFIYRLALKYNLIKETELPVVFYFERNKRV